MMQRSAGAFGNNSLQLQLGRKPTVSRAVVCPITNPRPHLGFFDFLCNPHSGCLGFLQALCNAQGNEVYRRSSGASTIQSVCERWRWCAGSHPAPANAAAACSLLTNERDILQDVPLRWSIQGGSLAKLTAGTVGRRRSADSRNGAHPHRAAGKWQPANGMWAPKPGALLA